MGKGERTRAAILDQALAVTSTEGVTGLTIGTLADRLGMSKSGLFAHFGSKELLQQAVLEHALALFTERVLRPAVARPRGLPRVETFFDGWIVWIREGVPPGGCPLETAAKELDDKPGPLRDLVARTHGQLIDFATDLARRAVAEGHLRRDLDAELFAFEMTGIAFGFSHMHRMMRHPGAERLARTAFAALLDRSRPT
ncbi:TetR/AcrR family transcriptional regulator [Rhodospirillum centenum]|uniref:Transcriptional regulator, TetR family protein n=1 Tax=Rhodospirillum centenum (strain ATCC 51521 / SW) TaxID=414684 RepID=B6IQV2_RHOCS|nr:TetR/AcrR family transcriptional regulator [Rhodospirillum centenum]ACI97838.1 transcriptional regulator, TetR family protein [Rhodospirillum centenum SW]